MPDLKVHDTRPLIQYVADGVQTVFSFPFAILAAEHLAVVLQDGTTPSGVTIAGVGDSDGGTATFSEPPVAGSLVTLYRDMPIARMTDFLEAGEFRAAAINAELDRLAMLIQQAESLAATAVRRGFEDTDDALVLPARGQRAGQVLTFDGAGQPTVSPTATASVQTAETAAQDAAGHRDKAALWADGAEDVPVEADSYSARHWAAKAIVDLAAEARRSDLVALRALVAGRAPGVLVAPVLGFDTRIAAGLDDFVVTRAGGATTVGSDGSWHSVPPDRPRLDHDRSTGAVLGLLCEEARTNHLHASLAPSTQTRLLPADQYTLSVYGAGSCDLSGAVSGTASEGAPATFTLNAEAEVTFTVSGTLIGFQCEQGRVPTSLIETPADGPADRAADDVRPNALPLADTAAASYVVTAQLPFLPSSGRYRILHLHQGGWEDSYILDGDVDFVRLLAKVDGVWGGTLQAVTEGWTPGDTHRFGVTLDGDTRTLYADGVLMGTETLASPTGMVDLQIGGAFDGERLNGHIRDLLVFDRPLGAADMAALTALAT